MSEQKQLGEPDFQEALAHQQAAEEVEVWSGAYSVRMFLPAMVAGLPITGVVFAIAQFKSGDSNNNTLRYSLEGMLVFCWLLLLGLACYRVLGTEYLLTNKRLYCRRGFGHPGHPAMELAVFHEVSVHQSGIERRLRAGRISLSVANSFGSSYVIAGIVDPERVANIFRKQIRAAHSEEG